MKSQRDAVLECVTKMAAENGYDWSEGQDIKKVTNKDFQQAVADVVTLQIINGEVEMRNKKSDPKELRRYVVGMVNDAFRKDRRLNGDVKYEYKNPGSRVGAGNDVVRTLKGLLKTNLDDATRAGVQAELDAELAKIKPAAPKVDLSVLPADMLARLGLSV